MADVNSFGQWFRRIIEQTGLKQKAIAAEADIDPVSLSRILNGEHGAARETARALVRAINKMTGRTVADEATALSLVAGISQRGRPQNIAEFLAALESLGLEFGDMLADRKKLEDYTEDDFEELLERIQADIRSDIDIKVRRRQR